MSAERDSYAYFTITSTRPLRDIEAHMGVVGDGRCWSVGDQRINGPKGTYHFSLWSLLSGVESGRPIDEHLQALWRRLSIHRDKIINLPEGMVGSISCVGYFNSHLDTVEVASGHFSTAAYYGLILDFDFYFDDEFGHDKKGKSYWSW